MLTEIKESMAWIEAHDRINRVHFDQMRRDLVGIPGIETNYPDESTIVLLNGRSTILKLELDCGEFVLSVPRREQERFSNIISCEDVIVDLIARFLWQKH